MMLIQLAWRNVWRNKKRSLIIWMAIAIGLWAGIFLVSFYNGMISQRLETAIRQEFSHLQIHDKNWSSEHELQFTLHDAEKLTNYLHFNDSIVAWSGRIVAYGMLANARGHSGIKIYGVHPIQEDSLTRMSTKLVEGSYLNPEKTNEIIIGRGLASKLNAKLKSKIVVTIEGLGGNLISVALRVVGIFETANALYDENNAFTQIHSLDAPAGIPGQIHEMAIFLKQGVPLTTVQSALIDKFSILEVKNWMEISPELELTSSMTDQMILIYMGIILLALSFGIINTMLMSVLERTSELGMLMAIGMSRFRMFIMILMETIFLVISASPVGIACAMLTNAYFAKDGIHMLQYKEAYKNFGYSDVIYPSIESSQLLLVLILLMGTAIISALAPAIKVLSIKPIKAIRN